MTDRFGRMTNGAEHRHGDDRERRRPDEPGRDRDRERPRDRGDRDGDRDRERERDRDRDRDVRQHRDRDRDGRRDDRDRDGRRPTRRSRSRSPPSRSRSRSRSSSYERRRKERKRKRVSGWDVPPSAEQLAAAASAALAIPGIAPLLGVQPVQAAGAGGAAVSGSIHPSRLGMVAGAPTGLPPAPFSAPLPQPMLGNPATARQARRLYVGNLPLPINEFELRALFNSAFTAAFPQQMPGDAVVSVYLNVEKKFGFVEWRTAEEATLALQLDGIGLRGVPLRVKRPSDYTPPVPDAPIGGFATPALPSHLFPNGAPAMSGGGSASGRPAHVPGRISDQVPDGPNKLFCGGLPYSLPEKDIMDLLASYGELRGFHLKRDKETNQSKGYAFFEYADPSVTDEAVAGLNNISIGERTLTVRRAQNKAMGGGPLQPQQYATHTHAGMPDLSTLFTAPSVASIPTRVLVLLNMVAGEELRDAGEYGEIVEDVRAEMGKYGRVVDLMIPREGERGCGKVFVEFAEVSEAMKARAEVEGRSFANRTVACEYMEQDKFHRKDF